MLRTVGKKAEVLKLIGLSEQVGDLLHLVGDLSPKGYGRSALADSEPVFGRQFDTNQLATPIAIRT
ncbi:MAG: hypothetical protein LBC02_10370 [Planctomycetaceae bacterium]|jgi:hypothetical protein|nr:hypothetical protein [Planctomycetaceae bacterium]